MARARPQLDEPRQQRPAAGKHAAAPDTGSVLAPATGTADTSGMTDTAPAPSTHAIDSAAAAAIERLLQRLEGRGLDAKLAAVERERREAPGLVAELLALPEARRSAAAASARFATPEVMWRLLEVARESAPAAALQLLGQARKIALHLAALRPAASLPIQLRVEVSCETAHRHMDRGDLAAAAARLREAAAELRPILGYGRALYCRALARLRRAEHRWEEALALGDRAVRLLDEHGSASEMAAATVEQGWLLLDAGEPDEAVPLFEKALPEVETIPYPAVTCRLGLAIALLESGLASDRADRARVEALLADAEWMISQASAGADQARLRWLAKHASARCRQNAG